MERRYIGLIAAVAILALLAAGYFVSQQGAKEGFGEKIEFKTSDGWVIVGSYLAPPTKPAPVLILLHMYGRTRYTWRTVAKTWNEMGFAVLAIDLRGHGESTTRDGKSLTYRQFTAKEFAAMENDVKGAIDFLLQEKGGDIDKDRIFVIGASIGANTALRAGCIDERIRAIVLLSPGFAYHVPISEDLMKCYGERPVLFIAAKGDAEAYVTCEKLYGLASGVKEFKVLEGSAHGTQMFVGNEWLAEYIGNWLKEKV